MTPKELGEELGKLLVEIIEQKTEKKIHIVREEIQRGLEEKSQSLSKEVDQRIKEVFLGVIGFLKQYLEDN